MFINPSKMIKKGGGRGGAILGILMLLLLTINPVYAQESTPEPTSTPTPVPTSTITPYYAPTNQIPGFNTPTPSVQGDCPDYVRDLDRELSLNWMKACSKCPTGKSVITPIPRLPTISYGNLGTPVPTVGITPTVSPTPNTQNWRIQRKINNVWTTFPAEGQEFYTTFNNSQWNNGLSAYSSGPFPKTLGIHEIGHLDTYYLHPSYGGGSFNLRFWGGQYTNGLGFDIVIVESNLVSLPVGYTHHFVAGEGHDYVVKVGVVGGTLTNINWELKYNVILYGGNTYSNGPSMVQEYNAGTYQSNKIGNTKTTWYNGTVPVADIGYCSNYVYADEEEADDPLVGMPDISIWQGVCMDFVPPFSWFRDSAGSYLFDVDLSFPGIGICPIWVELGDMELAGITIPMDILFLPAVMFIFGLLFKM